MLLASRLTPWFLLASLSMATSMTLCADEKKFNEFKKKAHDQLSLDGGGYLTYLAPSRVNLQLMKERYPDIEFRETREH